MLAVEALYAAAVPLFFCALTLLCPYFFYALTPLCTYSVSAFAYHLPCCGLSGYCEARRDFENTIVLDIATRNSVCWYYGDGLPIPDHNLSSPLPFVAAIKMNPLPPSTFVVSLRRNYIQAYHLPFPVSLDSPSQNRLRRNPNLSVNNTVITTKNSKSLEGDFSSR